MISQIASAPLPSVIRTEMQSRSPDNRPSVDRTAPPAEPAHANAHTSRQAKLAALQSSLQDIAIRRDSTRQLRSAYSEMAPHLDRMKQLAQEMQSDRRAHADSAAEFDSRRSAIDRLSAAIGKYEKAVPTSLAATETELDKIEISAPSDAIAATASIDVLLSTIQTLDKSLDDYEQVLAEQADSLTSLTGGQDTEEYGLKQLEKQIDAEQMTTRTALLKQIASASLGGFAGHSGLLPILAD